MLEKWNHCISCVQNSSVKGSMLYITEILSATTCYFTGKGNELYKRQPGEKKKTMIKHWKFSIEDLHDTFYRKSHSLLTLVISANRIYLHPA